MTIIPPWAKALIFAAVMAALFYSGRVYERRIWQAETAKAETEQVKQAAAQQVAGANFDALMARVGTQVVTSYVERLEADRPAVERAVTRVRNICLRSDGANRVSGPVPGGSGVPEAGGGEAGNGGDGAYIAAVQRDLRVCSAELVRLDESARYLRIQDGEEP